MFTKIMILLTLGLVVFLVLAPPLHQDTRYHSFADQRVFFGIPNFCDVVSNLPFLIVGLLGLIHFRDVESRVLFFGVFATAIGSSYYHLHPDNARLFWDRLPMTIVFMCLFALALKRNALVLPLVAVGVVSVVWWRVTDNLWPYVLVQFGPMIPLIVLSIRKERGLAPVIVLYGLSKFAEFYDRQIYSVLPFSGHTLKHVLAGIATWYIYRWVQAADSARLSVHAT